MKKIVNILLIISVFCNLLIFNIDDVSADTYAVTIIDKDGVNIRSGAGTNYGIVATVSYSTVINLVSKTLYNKGDKACSGGWYNVNYKGNTKAYVCSNLVKVNSVSSQNKYYTSSVWGSRINENYATVRKSGSFSATKLDTIYLGTTVSVIGSSAPTSDCKEGWAKIAYYNNTKTGYVCKRLISTYEDLTSKDATYEKELKSLGFPDSYIPFLVKLHKTHPNWVFKPSLTKLNFNTVVDNETGKNYIQSKVPAYIRSDTPKEAGTWYDASKPVVAFYLDPRNYLTERNIFAFELLGYDEKEHTPEKLKTMFGSSYLASDEYIGYFMKAGKDFGVSPLHLASRVIQEGGSNENYAGVSGKVEEKYNGKSLKGIYNYYNIGATSGDSPVYKGLATAAGYIRFSAYVTNTPWDTREKAIYYGAKYISSGYIKTGQDTMYYEKFNTSPKSDPKTLYSNQYMTNIIAPASESLTMYYTYNDLKLLDSNYVFEIPVYTNMPTEFTIHPLVGDTNNDLKELKVNGSMVNGFDPDILDYPVTISKNAKTVTIVATAKSSKAKVSGAGVITINTDKMAVPITVTSEIGEVKTYIVTLERSDKEEEEAKISVDDVINKVDVKISNGYLSGITPGTTATLLANNINKQEINCDVTILDKNKKAKTGVLATGDIITLKTNVDEKTFTIVIKGDTNGDGKVNGLDLLRVQKHIIKASTLSGAFKEACDTNYDDKINGLDLLRVQKHIVKVITLK